jgi:hypothetical protein
MVSSGWSGSSDTDRRAADDLFAPEVNSNDVVTLHLLDPPTKWHRREKSLRTTRTAINKTKNHEAADNTKRCIAWKV